MEELFEKYNDEQNIDIFPDGKIFRISYDSSVRKLKIVCKKYELFEDLRKSFSAPNQASFFMSRYGYKIEDKVYAINKFGYFSSGLVFDVLDYIKQTYGSTSVLAISKNCLQYILDNITPLKSELQNKDKLVANIADDVGRNNELIKNGKHAFEYRDYQKNAISYLIYNGYGRGLIEIPTAGGKSFILANFIWNILKYYDRKLKTLILVPNKQLVEQFYKDLIDYGYSQYELTRFTAGLKKHEAFNPDAKIIIANRQYIFKNINKLPKVDILICDEVHQCTSESTKEFIERLNCKIKIGCSGTIPRDKYQRWQLIGMFGRIVYTEDIIKLQESGFISKLNITLLKIIDNVVENDRNMLFHTNSLRKYRPDETGYSEIEFDEAVKAEDEYFVKHYKDLYKPVFEYLFNLNTNTLILFDRIEIGKNLFEYAKELYLNKKDVFYIDGSINVKDREFARESFEKCDGNLLIAQSSIMSTGVNIKRLTNLVFLTSSKSFSRVIQSIGRTLRLHESKDAAHLIDVSFNFKYSQRHLNERLKLYKEMYNKKPDKIYTFEI